MFARRCITIISFLLTTSILLTGCATPTAPPPAQPELPTGSDAEWTLIVIGDSSLGGLGKALASQIENDVGVRVVRYDSVVPELSAGHVLEALEMENPPSQSWEEELAEAMRQAKVLVVVMFVNPVDSVDPEKPLDLDGCFASRAPASCPPESFQQWASDLKAIWARILELRAGQPAILRATDLYNPLVAPWKEHGVLEACTVCWENMSQAARLAAEAYGISFLSRYDAFNGADHGEDPREKGFIVGDGEHPSDLAAQYTAELLSQMGYEPLSSR